MTRDDIIRMAREAGLDTLTDTFYVRAVPASVERFARAAYAAGAVAEREACAKVCEELLSQGSSGDTHMDGVLDCLFAIRGRGPA